MNSLISLLRLPLRFPLDYFIHTHELKFEITHQLRARQLPTKARKMNKKPN